VQLQLPVVVPPEPVPVYPPIFEPRELTSLQQAFVNIFGEYEPIRRDVVVTEFKTVLLTDSMGNKQEQLVAVPVTIVEYGFNWTWAASVLLFALVLIAFFKCISGVFRWKI